VQRLSEIKTMLADRGLHPRHRFGQNFLHDHNFLKRLVASAGVKRGDLVLEVGPGTGTLTEALIAEGADVIAVEIDRDLAELVQSRLGEQIRLICGDCLGKSRRLAPELVAAIGGRPFKLVANLPYQVASPLMCELLLTHANCVGQWITIQNEVADRLLASPGTAAWGPLSVIVRAMASVERLAVLPPTCFWPTPKVTSAMVGIIPTHTGRSDPHAFAAFVTKLFSTRRKQLGGVLGRELVTSVGIDPMWRCERLSIDEFWRLHERVACG
jgi:16S rRNA (adenine1518-N6/adenine1519-N6)-dimethyltransferase